MDGEIKRGEVYWVSLDSSIGSELKTGRPAVVLSGDRKNARWDSVIIAFLTTSASTGDPFRVGMYLSGKFSQVLCDQVRTVDKQRLTRYIDTISETDMVRVTGALANAMCIPVPQKKQEVQQDDNEEKVRMLEEEIASLRTRVATKKEVDTSVLVERDMWKKMYETVMDELVSVRVAADIEKRIPTAPAEVVVDSVAEEETEGRVDINSCAYDELTRVGVSPVLANRVIEHRPYKSVEELKAVSGITKNGFRILKDRVCCIPVKVQKTVIETPVEVQKSVTEKVNINTATVKELVEIAGISPQTARNIVAYRVSRGKFVCIDDLLNVPRFGKICLKKYGPMLEV